MTPGMTSKLLHLQGLRSMAIIFVVLFHFFPQYFPNGYLGVDQFFLLSGYLMTMMLEKNPELSTGSLVDFFYRRVKRIVPLYYLATFVILLFIRYTPTKTWKTNFDSAIYAVFLSTNLIRPTGLESYREKLGMGVDMFTHTWSLSLEMQFYFLFPLIFYPSQMFRNRSRILCLSFFVAISFLYHAFADDFISFNSVFARIWQFTAGLIIYYESNRREARIPKGVLEEPLLEDEVLERTAEPKELPLRRIVALICLAATVAMFSSKEQIGHLAARTVTILMTMLIVHVGERCWLLENGVMVFIGEISYGWYLVHWPVVALLKMHGLETVQHMMVGLLISLLVSIVVYFVYEKHYRFWDRQRIAAVVAGLLLSNAVVLFSISRQIPNEGALIVRKGVDNSSIYIPANHSSFIYESDYVNELQYGYENTTNEERAMLNDYMTSNDGSQLKDYPCTTRLKTKNDQLFCCLTNWTNAGSNMTLLVMGNSYVGNAMKTITEQCKDVFPRIYSLWITACAPLLHDRNPEGFDCSADGLFMDTVRETKPDVLIIPARLFDVRLIDNGTNPFNDRIFKEMIERITELQSLVATKIYILDAFEWPPKDLPVKLSRFLRNGTQFTINDVFALEQKQGYYVTKKRLARLVHGCAKCELFDYTNQFFVNGKLHYFDPKYFVSYFNSVLHVTPVGMARIAPLYHHICHNI